jgi:hypothetical protein
MPQVQQQRLVVRPFVAGGELRDDFKFLVNVHELVAEAGKHDAADVGA